MYWARQAPEGPLNDPVDLFYERGQYVRVWTLEERFICRCRNFVMLGMLYLRELDD